LPHEVADDEANEHEAGEGHQDFAADGRAEEIANKVHRKKRGLVGTPEEAFPATWLCKEVGAAHPAY